MDWPTLIVASFSTLILAVLLSIAVANHRAMPRLRLDNTACPKTLPPVSVLLPVRNEARNITQCLQSLSSQSYPTIEIVVLDDNSTDATAHLASEAAAADPRIRLVAGAPLPDGWSGKNWACHQLAQQARYDYLLFTDADVRWQRGALHAVMAEMERTSADLLSVWPTQITVSLAERIVVPLMSMALLAYLPVTFAHQSPYPTAAAANGQCMLFRRKCYHAIGGHASIAPLVLDDVTLARAVKRAGCRLRLVDANFMLTCRMYQGWKETINGYAKNIRAGHANSSPLLLLSTLVHWVIFLLPWIWLFLGMQFALPYWPHWPILLISAGLLVRAVTAWTSRQRILDALTLPLGVLLLTLIAAKALWWQVCYGGPVWKDRIAPHL